MASNVIRVSLLADAKDFERGFGKAQTKAVGFGSAVGTMAGNLVYDLGQRALGAITDFVGESADAFTRLEQAVGGTEAVFGDARGVIDDFADNSADSIGLSEAAFREATTSIGGQLKRMTGDVDLAAERSVELTGVAADLAATYGGTTAEAVQALGAAFRGEADPAERFNLNLKIGKQNAKAVEMGLADTTSEVDDHARALGLLELITEQSTDAQGQFARESETAEGRHQRLTAAIEDQQAALGESAKEWELFWLQQKSNVAEGGAVVLNWFSAFSDDVTSVQRDMRDFEIRTGETADTAAAAITIWKDYGQSMYDLIPAMDLNREELEKLRDADEDYLKQLGWTEEGIRKVKDIVEDELVGALTDQEQAARDAFAANREYEQGLDDVEGQSEETEDQTRSTTEALQEQDDTLRAMADPMFAAIQATRDIEEAQKNYNDAVEEHGPKSREAIEASEDLMEANMDLRQAFIDLQEQGIDPTSEAARNMLRDVGGLSPQQIDAILDTFRSIQDQMPVLDLSVRAPGVHYTDTGGGNARPRKDKEYVFHEGGRVPGIMGQEVDARLEAGEEVISADAVKRLEGARRQPASQAQTVIHLTVNAGMGTDGYEVGKQIVEALQQYNRVGGPIRLDVRTE